MLEVENIKLTDDPLKNILIMAPYLDGYDQCKVLGLVFGLIGSVGNQDERKDSQEGGDNMVYPKSVMKISELTELGFSKEYLKRCVNNKYHGHTFAVKTGTAKNSTWLIDTAEFEKKRKRGVLV